MKQPLQRDADETDHDRRLLLFISAAGVVTPLIALFFDRAVTGALAGAIWATAALVVLLTS